MKKCDRLNIGAPSFCRYLGLMLVMIMGGVVPPAQAVPITFIGSSEGLSAEVTLDTVATALVVTLTNTAIGDVLSRRDVLTAVYFSLPNGLSLTPLSATICPSCSAPSRGTEEGGNIGGEWAYNAGFRGPNGADRGIASAGLGHFGDRRRFPGANFQGPGSPAGLQYGLASAGDDPTTGVAAVTRNTLIQNTVVFLLTGLPDGFDPSVAVTNVSFQYGPQRGGPNLAGVIHQLGDLVHPDDPTVTPDTLSLPYGPQDGPIIPVGIDPSLTHAPEPTSLVLFGSGVAALGALARMRRRRVAQSL